MSAAYSLPLELPHFIMELKMLLGIKQRAEQARDKGAVAWLRLFEFEAGGQTSMLMVRAS